MVQKIQAVAVALCISFPAAGRAQDPQPDSLPAVPLDTLTATVLRAPVPVVRAPYAVSVVEGPALGRALPGLALEEALRATPGVQVDNRFNYALGERISVRGFGARAQFGIRGVRVLVDGIPATMPDGQTTLNHLDPLALERAEVIRGPAGALYGNASGGVILLETEDPPLVPLGSEFGATSGGDGLLRLGAEVGGTQGRWQYGVSGTRLTYDGFRSFSEAENLQASARVGYQGLRDRVRLIFHGVDYRAQNPGSLSDSLLRVDRSQAFGNNVRQQTGERGQHAQAGVVWEHRADAGLLQFSAYGLARELDNPIPPVVIDLSRRAAGARASWSAALPGLQGGRWTVGAETQVQRDHRENFANEQGERGTLTLEQRERVANVAAFAQALVPIGNRVEVLGALRWDRFYFSVGDDLPVAPGNPDDSGNLPPFGELSPTVGVSWVAVPALTLYTNFATAFETPTTTELANRPDGSGGLNPELEPQRTLSYEAGTKGLLGRWGRFGVALYRARVRDALIPFEIEGQQGRQFFRNAGSAVHRGVEASVEVAPLPGLSGRVAYTLTDARFDEFVIGADTLDGNRVPGVAPHRLAGRVAWNRQRGAFAEADALLAGATPADNNNRFESPSYTVVDLRAGWQDLRVGGVRATPFLGITNLFDRRYNASVVVNAFGGRFFEPAPGRTLYLGARVRTHRTER